MKKSLLLLLLTIQFVFAQKKAEVLVNHPNYPSSALTLNHSEKGFLLPKVYLENVTNSSPLKQAQEGMLVYNTHQDVIGGEGVGIYMWINNRWIRSGENSNTYLIKDQKQSLRLGYNQLSASNAPADITFKSSAGELLNVNRIDQCVKNQVNGHSYCFYEAVNNGVNWQDAFLAAKEIGGYLVTITSREEQNFIEKQLVNKGLAQNAWLGIRKAIFTNVSNQPITPENTSLGATIHPITGESFQVEWGNTPKIFHNFYNLEPDNNLNSEGCVLLFGEGIGSGVNGYYTQYKWGDYSCKINKHLGQFADQNVTGDISLIIVEFDK